MPSHVATGASGSRGKARYRSKHYHRKTNSKTSNRYTRQQGTSSPNPEPESKHPSLPARLSSKGVNVTQVKLPPPPRYSQRKPWIWTLEAGNITILRRQDAEKPKGSVPSWLADTFGSLPKKHPLRETVDDSVVMESMNPALDDDDKLFAYQPPSPSRTPSNTQDLAFPYLTQAKPYSTPSHRMGLSSIPFAPPTFVEPAYEDHYQDMAMPLNDFGDEYDPENPAYFTNITSGDHDSESVLPTSRTTPQFAPPQRMSSPIFSSGGYPPSPMATTPTFNTISSDDITLPTPTHYNISTPETDEIQDALRANHSFVTSMYASSPARSFRGVPLDALVGSRESSPHDWVATSRNIPTPDAMPRPIWTPRKKLPQTYAPPRPASSDVYKSRLLAYATAIADHMSSSGDEDLVRQQTNKRVDLLETDRAAGSPGTQNASSFGLLDERVLNTLSEDLGPSGHGNDHAATPGPYTETMDPNDWTEPKLVKSLATGRLDHSAARIHTTSPEFGVSDNDRSSDQLAPKNLDGNFGMADAHLEDWEKEHQSEGIVDEFEEGEPLVSEYEVMQEEYDVLAADEPSDDESGLTQQYRATTPQQGSEGEHSVLEVDSAASTLLEAPERDPRIQPFPMKVSRHSPVRDIIAPGENQPVLSRLSPKFVSQPSRHVRPSPFATLLKKRFKDYPDAVRPKSQDDGAAVEDKADEIETWSG